MSIPPGEGEEFAKWEQSAKDVCLFVRQVVYRKRGFSYISCSNWISLAERLCAACQSLIYSPIFSAPLFLSQQTAENQSGGAAAKRSSTSGNSFTSNVKRQASISSSNNSGGKVSISDNAGTSTSSATKGSSRSGSSSTKGATKNDRRGSVVSTLEEVSVLSSEKELEEESRSGGVGVPSSSGNASSLNTMLGSSLSSSLSQSSGCSDTDGMTSDWPLCVDL